MTSGDNNNKTEWWKGAATNVTNIILIVLIGGLILAALDHIYLGNKDLYYAGPLLFGVVIGWVTYRTLRRDGSHAHISDIASVAGAVGGTAVTRLVDLEAIGWYLTGLFGGFFLFYLVHSLFAESKDEKSRELLIGRNEEDT